MWYLAATVACILVARLSDRVGRKPIYLAGTILGMVMAFPLFWLLDTASLPIVLIASAIMGTIEGGFFYSIQPSYFGELFPTKFRYLGMSLGYQAATVLVGATAPIIGLLLIEWAGGSTWAFSLYRNSGRGRESPRAIARPPEAGRSFRLDASGADDLAPGLRLDLDARREFFRRACHRFEAEHGQALLDLRQCKSPRDLGLHRRDDLVRRSGGGEEPDPGVAFDL